jgi:hypothetical protein
MVAETVSNWKQSGTEVLTPLGCYAEYVDSWLQTFKNSPSVPSSWVKLSKKMGPTGFLETLGNNY